MLEEVFIYKIVFLIILAFLSYEDMRYKKISLNVLILLFISEAVIYIFLFLSQKNIDMKSLAVNFIFSLVLFVIAKLTGEKIAYGDVLCLSLIGFYMKKERFYLFLSSLMLFIGLFSAIVILINIFRANYRKDISIPMLPFVFITILLMEIMK